VLDLYAVIVCDIEFLNKNICNIRQARKYLKNIGNCAVLPGQITLLRLFYNTAPSSWRKRLAQEIMKFCYLS
jgi:hypothetical protein